MVQLRSKHIRTYRLVHHAGDVAPPCKVGSKGRGEGFLGALVQRRGDGYAGGFFRVFYQI